MGNELTLTGLHGSHPLGFMAALGLLRSLAELENTLGATRLSWSVSAPWQPMLTFNREVTAPELIALLLQRQTGRDQAPELVWSEDIKVAPNIFLDACRHMAGNTASLDFMAAFGSDAVRRGDTILTTPFRMVSGQQRLLRMGRELACSLCDGESTEAMEAFEEGLFGPWRYNDTFHSFGWDPATERLHALRARRPSSELARGVRAAIWLAFEGLALLPSAPDGQRLATTGFDRNRSFSWPLWAAPLTVDGVRVLLGQRDLVRRGLTEGLRARGVTAVFRSQRMAIGTKGYATFRPAALVVHQPEAQTRPRF